MVSAWRFSLLPLYTPNFYFITFILFACDSDEAARDSRKAWADPNPRSELVRSAVVRHIRRRIVRGINMADIEPQVMRMNVGLSNNVYKRGAYAT